LANAGIGPEGPMPVLFWAEKSKVCFSAFALKRKKAPVDRNVTDAVTPSD
jgi:hypothetical protein